MTATHLFRDWKKREASTFLLSLVLSATVQADPSQSVQAALFDAHRLPPQAPYYVRYFDFSSIPQDERLQFKAAFIFHVNSLSTQAEFFLVPQPFPVITNTALPNSVWLNPNLVRIDLRDPGWDPAVFERLKDVEPYFHSRVIADVDVTREEFWPGGVDKKGDSYDRGSYPVTVKAGKSYSVANPALPQKDILELARLCSSEVPIVRADWFFFYTSQNVDRVAGYYAFLGIKNYQDIRKLTGLNEKLAQKILKEVAAIVPDSGVAKNNRQILYEPAITGGVWITYDVKTSVGKQNAKVQRNGDFFDNADANEVYFTLPNELFGLAAVNNKEGTLQDTVPDFIAADKQSTSNDLRVHASISCIRCHVEGLRPIHDWAREFYKIELKKDGALITSVSYEKLKRLQALYLGNLQDKYDLSLLIYKRALVRLLGNGWTPERVSAAYREAFKRYQDDQVSSEQLALELGVDQDTMRKAFTLAAAAKGANADVILTGYARKAEFTARREHVEEAWTVLSLAIKGAIVP
jgi:hypothetical protein